MKNSPKQTFKYYVFLFFSKFFSYEQVKKYYKKTMTKYNSKNTAKVVTDGSYSYKKESIERNWVNNLASISFCNETFMTYKNTDEYLSHFYGDYMKLPPLDKRSGHSLLSIDFGNYE